MLTKLKSAAKIRLFIRLGNKKKVKMLMFCLLFLFLGGWMIELI